jgi:hypothetical protein
MIDFRVHPAPPSSVFEVIIPYPGCFTLTSVTFPESSSNMGILFEGFFYTLTGRHSKKACHKKFLNIPKTRKQAAILRVGYFTWIRQLMIEAIPLTEFEKSVCYRRK